MVADMTDELFRVADFAAELRAEIRNERLQKPLTAIHTACDEIKRAWSGSNIGYHATVYYAGLRPKPSEVQFSAEWGLMDRWPTHQPNAGWQMMDHQTVLNQIQERSGRPDLTALARDLEFIREKFFGLQEESKSILTAILADTKDTFLSHKSLGSRG